jgi:hypothetical protein
MRDLRLALVTLFKLRSSELGRRVVLWQDINISEDLTASIFIVKMEAQPKRPKLAPSVPRIPQISCTFFILCRHNIDNFIHY